MSVLEFSKTLMYEFWHDYIKPKYQKNAKLCYMDRILTVLFFLLKLKICIKIFQMMLKNGLTCHIMKLIDHFQEVLRKK